MIFSKSLIAVLLLICIITSVFSGCSENSKDNTQTTDNNVSTEENTSDTSQSSDLLELTKDDLEYIEEYLNKIENNGFVCYNCYSSPNEINIAMVFYHGAGISVDSSQFSDAERLDFLYETGWEEFYFSAIKIPFEAANALLTEKCGLSLFSFHNGYIPSTTYIRKYDAYYRIKLDANNGSVKVVKGEICPLTSNYIIHYTDLNSSDSFVVTLKKTENGYMFVSNLKVQFEEKETTFRLMEHEVYKIIVSELGSYTEKEYSTNSVEGHTISFLAPDYWDPDKVRNFEGFEYLYSTSEYFIFDNYMLLDYYKNRGMDVEQSPFIVQYKDYFIERGTSEKGYPYIFYYNEYYDDDLHHNYIDGVLFIRVSDQYLSVCHWFNCNTTEDAHTIINSIEYKYSEG